MTRRNVPIRLAAAAAFTLLFALSGLSESSLAADPDDDCLACHNDKDLKSESGLSVYVDLAKHQASVHSILPCASCHTDIKEFPHPKRIAKVQCAACHQDATADLPKSVHGALGDDACAACHGEVHYTQAAAGVTPQACASCHKDVVREFLASAHGAAMKRGGPNSPTCDDPFHARSPRRRFAA